MICHKVVGLRLGTKQTKKSRGETKRRSNEATQGPSCLFPHLVIPFRLFPSGQAQQEHDESKEMFDMLNDQLIAELPQLLNLRVPYFDPSFEAIIRMQAKFAEEGYEKLSGVQR